MSSYMEQVALLEKGKNSKYYDKLMDFETPDCPLTEEQYALMALICDNIGPNLTEDDLHDYVLAVERAQLLMPSGNITSRQMLVTLALFAGIAGV